jgi:hypothetical protein
MSEVFLFKEKFNINVSDFPLSYNGNYATILAYNAYLCRALGL